MSRLPDSLSAAAAAFLTLALEPSLRGSNRHCKFTLTSVLALCLCAQVASKQEVYPSTCRLDESIKVAVSLQTYDSWQTNEERSRLEKAGGAGTKNPQTDVVVAKINQHINS